MKPDMPLDELKWGQNDDQMQHPHHQILDHLLKHIDQNMPHQHLNLIY